jgi:hypothetical protein
MKAKLKTPRINPHLVVFAAGLLLFAAGLFLVYPPAALIGPGLVLMAITLFGDRQ